MVVWADRARPTFPARLTTPSRGMRRVINHSSIINKHAKVSSTDGTVRTGHNGPSTPFQRGKVIRPGLDPLMITSHLIGILLVDLFRKYSYPVTDYKMALHLFERGGRILPMTTLSLSVL